MWEIVKLVLKLFSFGADQKTKADDKNAGQNEVKVEAQKEVLDNVKIAHQIDNGDVPIDGKLADWVRERSKGQIGNK